MMKKTPAILVSDQQTVCCFGTAAPDLFGWKMAEVLLDPVTSILNIFIIITSEKDCFNNVLPPERTPCPWNKRVNI